MTDGASQPDGEAAAAAADQSSGGGGGGGGGKRHASGGGGSSEDHWSVVLKKLAPQGYQKSPPWQQEIIERVVKQMTKRQKEKRGAGLSKEALARTIDLQALGVSPEAAEAFKAEEQRVAKALVRCAWRAAAAGRCCRRCCCCCRRGGWALACYHAACYHAACYHAACYHAACCWLATGRCWALCGAYGCSLVAARLWLLACGCSLVAARFWLRAAAADAAGRLGAGSRCCVLVELLIRAAAGGGGAAPAAAA